MGLVLTACTLALIVLMMLSLTTPVLLHGEVISMQVNLVPTEQLTDEPPKDDQFASQHNHLAPPVNHLAPPPQPDHPAPPVNHLAPPPDHLAPQEDHLASKGNNLASQNSHYSSPNGHLTPPQVVEVVPKYFREAGNTLILVHYDARFYRGMPVSDEERADTLHYMIRAYLSILRDLSVETWIAHGTLLGWWWNEKFLPWDSDLDTQVSHQTMDHMGTVLNQTMHTYRSGGVVRDYLLDVNPFYKERTHGDGSNIIDARWIDVRNGLFIDITAIAETDPAMNPGVWSCKNYHFYRTEDIWPLRMSYFEGVQAMVPNAYDTVLVQEYEARALNSTEFEGHHWDDKLQLWVNHPPTHF